MFPCFTVKLNSEYRRLVFLSVSSLSPWKTSSFIVKVGRFTCGHLNFLVSPAGWILCNGLESSLEPVSNMHKAENPPRTYPVHVEGEEDLVHIAVGILIHTLQVQDGLELEQGDES